MANDNITPPSPETTTALEAEGYETTIPQAPVVEEEEVDIVAATPRTRTASVSNLDLLRSIYGDDIANALLPTRTV